MRLSSTAEQYYTIQGLQRTATLYILISIIYSPIQLFELSQHKIRMIQSKYVDSFYYIVDKLIFWIAKN